MPRIRIEFTLEQSAGARSIVMLDRPGASPLQLHFAGGKCIRMIESNTAYNAPWTLIGAAENKIKVTWQVAGLTGTLLEGVIGEDDSSYPGGEHHRSGMGYLPAIPARSRVAARAGA